MGKKVITPKTKGVARVPVIMQMEALECGAALVVHPGLAVALVLPLGGIGASGSLVIPGSLAELRGGVFGKVMG